SSVISAALDMCSGSLAPTASYARRDWVWMPADPAAWTDGRLGTLTLVMQHGRSRAGLKVEVDHYGVQEELELSLPAGVRAFLLENDSDPDEYGPFRCVVGSVKETCNCESGGFDRNRQPDREVGCKHRAALLALVTEGVI